MSRFSFHRETKTRNLTPQKINEFAILYCMLLRIRLSGKGPYSKECGFNQLTHVGSQGLYRQEAPPNDTIKKFGKLMGTARNCLQYTDQTVFPCIEEDHEIMSNLNLEPNILENIQEIFTNFIEECIGDAEDKWQIQKGNYNDYGINAETKDILEEVSGYFPRILTGDLNLDETSKKYQALHQAIYHELESKHSNDDNQQPQASH